MQTVEYAPGRLVDVYGDPAQPTVLLWHGMQTDARASFGPLAGMLAERGAAVVAPDWNSHAEDGGRADLLGSLDFARKHAAEPDAIVLVGWSMGGVAAAALAVSGDVQLAHTVCLAGAFMVPDPIFGRRVSDELSPERVGAPFTLLHGLGDDVVPVAVSTEFAASLQRVGWPVELVELAADHGSIAGADYDAAADRYEPGKSEEALRVAEEVAARIAGTFRYE
ncbi:MULTISPECIES: S9 family peptidase [unclassified Mycobacterium]|uniref:alpha/beta hydrolase family protein n=1 Tax=unclassified Mycobacterium TaxID=2642494 RepID=UPI000801EEA9|nr:MULTISPECIES: alpha/beta fold hydrolase [unclassified Mycobacterium]OBG61562.1 esterase [Mycobacterium sp. E3339]OBH90737.1 esterase [Mycobacterium sp. E2989]